MSNLKVQEEKNSLIIELPVELENAFVEELITESKNWLLKPVQMYIFNFKNVRVIKPTVYRGFVILSKMARQGEKQIASINMLPALTQQLKSDGVIASFNPMANTATPPSAAAPAKANTVDVAIINPFVEAVVNTLQMQAQTPSKPGKPFLLKVSEKEYKPPIGIVGILNLNSSKFTGSIALAFPEKVFLQIYENMFAEKHEKITAELQDAAAEILNIIYGTAKTQLNQIPGFDLQPAIPTVLTGDKMNVQQGTREKILILPFESQAGSFQMEIALENK